MGVIHDTYSEHDIEDLTKLTKTCIKDCQQYAVLWHMQDLYLLCFCHITLCWVIS